MDAQLFVILKALAAGVLLPALVGAATARWALRPPGPGAALALGVACGLLSGLAAIVTSGLVADARALPLVQLIAAARMLPPEEMPRALAPHLANLCGELARREGRDPGGPETRREVERMMGVLMRARGVDDATLSRMLPELLGELVRARERPGLLEHLTWSPQLDGALVVPLAAGLAGGALAGLVTGAIGGLMRAGLLNIPLPLVLPTLIAGLIGACIGPRLREDRFGPRAGFALGLALGLAQSAWAAFLAPPGALGPDTIASGGALALVHASALALVVLLLRLHRLESVRARLAQAEVRARLDLLTAQVQPHFLFNALNTIASTAGDPPVTRRLIGCLAQFLRMSLKPNPGRIALADELAHLEAYLDLERARWPDRLVVTVECEKGAGALAVPPLLVQPLVENAVAHGFRAGGEPLAVAVRARVANARLFVQVSDDGAGVPLAKLNALRRGEDLGIGLASVRERLRALDPPGTIELRAAPAGGLVVELALPARSAVSA